MQQQHKWQTADYSQAMLKAIKQSADKRYLKQCGDKLLFNGFWRSGDRQNVCAWLNKATWADAKTGQSGGCKDFAKLAFNLSLPQFMLKYGDHFESTSNEPVDIPLASIFEKKDVRKTKPTKPIDDIWQELCKRSLSRFDAAAKWLEVERGFEAPHTWIGSGFANLAKEDVGLFETPQQQNLAKHCLLMGPQLVAPLRGVHSEKVNNLFFRAMANVPKDEKSRLLIGAGGWKEADESPRGFGFPHLIKEFPNIVLCEGMADYFAAEILLRDNEKWLPIGAASANALNKWALWLSNSKYQGQVTIVYQPDPNDDLELTTDAAGPLEAIKAMQTFNGGNIKCRFFNWHFYLENTTTKPETIADLADSIRQESRLKECGPGHLNYCFEVALTWEKDF